MSKRKEKREKRNAPLGTLSRGILCLVLAALCLGAGCAPAKVLDSPAGWPVEWKGRKLYHTPHAYIYAGSDAAAWEADELAARVHREFKSRTRKDAVKGLLLVTNVNDPPAFASFRQFCDVKAKEAAAAEGRTLGEDELKKRHEMISAAFAEQGHDPESDLAMTPASIKPADLADVMDLAVQGAISPAWSVAVPTSALIEQANDRALQGEYEKRKVGLLVQLPLTPITLFEHRLRNVKALVARDVELFRNQMELQQDWSKEKRQEATHAYMEWKLAEGLLPVWPLLSDIVRLTTGVVDFVADPLFPKKDQPPAEEATTTDQPAPASQP